MAKTHTPSAEAVRFVQSLQWKGGQPVPADEKGFEAAAERLMQKAAVLAEFADACRQMKLYKEGKGSMNSLDELINRL